MAGMEAKPLPTTYDGTNFRSRLEAKWAAFFNLLGWHWEYETSTAFGEWMPDFTLLLHDESRTEQRVYVEAKPKKHLAAAIEKIEKSGCDDPVLILADGPDGFRADSERYFLGWYFHKGEMSRAIITMCSEQGLHFCKTADKRPHHRCGKLDQKRALLREHRTLTGYWREAGNRVQLRPPRERRQARMEASEHCWTLSRTREEPGKPPRSGVPRRWLAVGGGALIAGVAVALALVFALGSGDGESVAPPFEDRDCADFSSWAEAQALYEEAGGPASDPHSLDPDGDGVACERLREAEERASAQETPAAALSSGGDRDCGDFATWEEAQAFYEESGGPASDPHWLDPDEDGVACESLR